MRSDQSGFWDSRFRHEGAIWGSGPSATALTALRFLPQQARVLEIGFGYGRDLNFMVRQGCRIWGIDLSIEARHRTELRLANEGMTAECLETGSFETSTCPDGAFDGVVSHRMAHLLVTAEAVERFVEKVSRVLRPGGIVCLGVRNTEDIRPGEVRSVGDSVFEYTLRPGHWIRYWDDQALQRAFGEAFSILSLEKTCENESLSIPVPCQLTVMVGKKNQRVDKDHEPAFPRTASGDLTVSQREGSGVQP